MAAKKPAVPFSEDIKKQHPEWSADACKAELRRLVLDHPDKVITRNFFRVHSNISESTWTKYYGTFTEFKRQANIVPTRQQHAHERNIAKHVSVDHYRELNKERQDWGAKYVRKNKARYQTILAASDLHDKNIDPFFLQVFIDTAKRAKPDIIVLVGDVFDLPEFGKYTVDPRDWDVVGRIEFVHKKILAPLRRACPDAQIDFIEGNHEARLIRHLADATPALRAVLSDLHGFTIPKLLGLQAYEVNYIAKADLATYTLKDHRQELKKNYKVYFDSFIAHHFPEGRQLGLPGVNGHHHKQIMWSEYNELVGAFNWLQMGCGHMRDASFCNGQLWQNGFAHITIDTQTKQSIIDPIAVSDFTCVGGKYYFREDFNNGSQS